MSDRGFTVWITGLSGAGKSTIAGHLADRLKAAGHRVEVLDGDAVRTTLSSDLGFTKEARDANIRRIGYVARLLSRNGVAVVVAAISPYREVRDEVRRAIEAEGCGFVEVYARCSIQELAQRDVKGLYARALRGELEGFTGVSDPYEEPLHPDIVFDSETESVDASLAKILDHLGVAELQSSPSVGVPDPPSAGATQSLSEPAESPKASSAGAGTQSLPGCGVSPQPRERCEAGAAMPMRHGGQ